MWNEKLRRVIALCAGAVISLGGGAVLLSQQPGSPWTASPGSPGFYAGAGIVLLNLPGNLAAGVLFVGLSSATPLVLKVLVPSILNWLFWGVVIWLALSPRRQAA